MTERTCVKCGMTVSKGAEFYDNGKKDKTCKVCKRKASTEYTRLENLTDVAEFTAQLKTIRKGRRAGFIFNWIECGKLSKREFLILVKEGLI